MNRDSEVLKYLVAGGVAAAVEYGAFFVLHYWMSLNVVVAQVVSFLAGLLVAFLLHVVWTFNDRKLSKQSVLSRFILYALLAAVNIVTTSVLIAMLHKLAVALWLAKLIVMMCVVAWNYAILNKFIFKSDLSRLFTKKRLKKFCLEARGSALLFLLVAISGIALALSIPLGAGHDESAHVIKAEAVSRLDVFPDENGKADVNGKEIMMYSHITSISLWDLSSYASHVRNEDQTPEIKRNIEEKSVKPYNGDTRKIDASGAAGYNAIAYAPNALGLLLARVADTSAAAALYIARISAAIFFAAVVAFAHWLLRGYRARFIVYAVALFPPITVTFSAISADGFLNAATIVLSVIILRSVLDKQILSPFLRWLAIGLAVIIPMVKLPYIAISLLIAATPIVPGEKRRKMLFSLLFVAVVAIAGFGWTKAMQGPNETQSRRVFCCTTPASPHDQVKHILTHPLAVIDAMLSSVVRDNTFEEMGMVAHYWAQEKTMDKDLLLLYIVGMVLVASLCSVEIRGALRKYPRLYLYTGLSIMATAGLIYAALYVASTSVGQDSVWGVQGRYFLPLFMFVMIALSTCFSWIQSDRAGQSVERWLTCALAVIHLVSVWAFVIVL